MERKQKYSKDVKIKACRDYEQGKYGFKSISKQIGANDETVRRWYLKYKEHGPSTFETSSRNRSYSQKFKLSIVEEYTSGKCSLAELAAKHNIATVVVHTWVNKW